MDKGRLPKKYPIFWALLNWGTLFKREKVAQIACRGGGGGIFGNSQKKRCFFLKKTPDKNKKIDQVVEEIKFLSLFWPRVLTNLSKQLKIER